MGRPDNFALNVLLNALLEGLISEATGGKFENGAITGAFRTAFGSFKPKDSMVTGSKSGGGAVDVIVPSNLTVEQSGFKTRDEAAKAAGSKYGKKGVTNKQEVQIGLSWLGKENWAYLTPGWGPTNERIIDNTKLFNAYKAAGLKVHGWLHGHFDKNLNFSSNDFPHAWGEGKVTYMVNRNLETRILTNDYLRKKYLSIPSNYRSRGLVGLQQFYSNKGLSGELVK